jgi:hypothetical protein
MKEKPEIQCAAYNDDILYGVSHDGNVLKTIIAYQGFVVMRTFLALYDT